MALPRFIGRSPSPTTAFIPLPSTYAVVEIDIDATLAHVADAQVQSQVREHGTAKCLLFLDMCRQMDGQDERTSTYDVFLVGAGLRPEDPDNNVTPDMCVPIYPASQHPHGRAPVRTDPCFPFDNCYHWFGDDMAIQIRVKAGRYTTVEGEYIELSTDEWYNMREFHREDQARIEARCAGASSPGFDVSACTPEEACGTGLPTPAEVPLPNPTILLPQAVSPNSATSLCDEGLACTCGQSPNPGSTDVLRVTEPPPKTATSLSSAVRLDALAMNSHHNSDLLEEDASSKSSRTGSRLRCGWGSTHSSLCPRGPRSGDVHIINHYDLGLEEFDMSTHLPVVSAYLDLQAHTRTQEDMPDPLLFAKKCEAITRILKEYQDSEFAAYTKEFERRREQYEEKLKEDDKESHYTASVWGPESVRSVKRWRRVKEWSRSVLAASLTLLCFKKSPAAP